MKSCMLMLNKPNQLSDTPTMKIHTPDDYLQPVGVVEVRREITSSIFRCVFTSGLLDWRHLNPIHQWSMDSEHFKIVLLFSAQMIHFLIVIIGSVARSDVLTYDWVDCEFDPNPGRWLS